MPFIFGSDACGMTIVCNGLFPNHKYSKFDKSPYNSIVFISLLLTLSLLRFSQSLSLTFLSSFPIKISCSILDAMISLGIDNIEL